MMNPVATRQVWPSTFFLVAKLTIKTGRAPPLDDRYGRGPSPGPSRSSYRDDRSPPPRSYPRSRSPSPRSRPRSPPQARRPSLSTPHSPLSHSLSGSGPVSPDLGRRPSESDAKASPVSLSPTAPRAMMDAKASSSSLNRASLPATSAFRTPSAPVKSSPIHARNDFTLHQQKMHALGTVSPLTSLYTPPPLPVSITPVKRSSLNQEVVQDEVMDRSRRGRRDPGAPPPSWTSAIDAEASLFTALFRFALLTPDNRLSPFARTDSGIY